MGKISIRGETILSASALWERLRLTAGFMTQSYDQKLEEKVCYLLGIKYPCKDIPKALENRHVTVESLVGVIFSATEPYARMMSDLCAFFQRHEVKKTNTELKMVFDFGKGPEDLSFDLNHFKETLGKYKTVIGKVATYDWMQRDLWRLAHVFQKYWGKPIASSESANWIENYNKGQLMFPSISRIQTGMDPLDSSINKALILWASYVIEVRAFGFDLASCMASLQKYFSGSSRDREKKNGLQDYSVRDLNQLYIPLTDNWPRTMLEGMFGFVESLGKLSQAERLKEAQFAANGINDVFKDIPSYETEKELPIEDILDLLNLPIWGRRSELYQTWILSIIDEAFAPLELDVQHDNGKILFRFSGTLVAIVRTQCGPMLVWSELKSHVESTTGPNAKPLGKGRKTRIQPDYSLYAETSNTQDCFAVIECKQYQKGSTSNFSSAMNDYARGRPNAIVYLVNYGSIPGNISQKIEIDYLTRAFPFAEVLPRSKGRDEFVKWLNSTIDFQVELLCRKRKAGNQKKKPQSTLTIPASIDLIAIDISPSMLPFLRQQENKVSLRTIITNHPRAKLVVFDTKVIREWQVIDEETLLEFESLCERTDTDGTNIPLSLNKYQLKRAMVITDAEGAAQVPTLVQEPLSVLVARASGIIDNM